METMFTPIVFRNKRPKHQLVSEDFDNWGKKKTIKALLRIKQV